MKIRIVTSCTGEKRYASENQLKQDDFRLLHDPDQFERVEARLAEFRTPAEDLYTGQQHIRLMEGVRQLREHRGVGSVDLWILSAGYGLIPGDREVVPYECTFQGMKAAEIDRWAEHLQVPQNVRKLLAEQGDLALVLLGDHYLRALGLEESVEFKTPTLFFTGDHSRKRVVGRGPVRIVPLANRDTRRFSCGLVGLKGELAKRILARMAEEGEPFLAQLLDPSVDVLALLEDRLPTTDKPRKEKARPNPAVDYVIHIPESWWQKPHRQKLRYFIPEWDDRVDPNYDFLTDTHSGGSGDWSNEVYAHQLYEEPNYDGILVSKVVAEKTQKKKEGINALGVHRYLRVPPEFPIMGDCGAFGYINQETPPYTNDEILDYYTRLGFDYGVSIDHLIVTATEAQKHFRYQLTIHNAELFLTEHRARGLSWVPVGAAQGWDPQSYAEAARQYVTMGYRYIALGGLVRTTTRDILRILASVHEVVPETVSIHLFGLARIGALNDFAAMGVRSVDSASFLRRAWLGAGQNYLTVSGQQYAAIRIPEAGKSFRAKRIVDENRATESDVRALEQASLNAIRDFDEGKHGVERTLDALEKYDRLITTDRGDTRPLHRRTLEDAPWKSCPCAICRRDGVQVIIFRGNDRNRRRGFHNTFAFYHLLQRVLAGESITLGAGRPGPTDLQLPLFTLEGEDNAF